MSLLQSDFGGEYDLMLSAWGQGVLREADLLDMQKPDAILARFRVEMHRDPRDVSLLVEDPMATGFDYGFTGVDTALLEKFNALQELILPDSVTDLEVTPKLEAIFKRNRTMLRGSFDSFAERFARERGLDFRPADFVFAESFFEPARESTVLTLVFRRNGKPEVREDISSPGSSASHTFGGTFTFPLRKDFYKTMTAEKLAEKFRSPLREAALSAGKLAEFLAKARAHGYFTGKN